MKRAKLTHKAEQRKAYTTYRSGFDATARQAAFYRVRRRDCCESAFAPSFRVTLEVLMDRTIKIQQLYSELSAMENALKDFVKPRSANHPHEWTPGGSRETPFPH